jgi:hypothetical protein
VSQENYGMASLQSLPLDLDDQHAGRNVPSSFLELMDGYMLIYRDQNTCHVLTKYELGSYKI